jgi:glycosyltransferase involved in cell wall biosynthesis
VDIKIKIAGRNMERYRDVFFHPKVEFLGFVENLSAVIMDADYFLCPIFKGSGMKVKICEALMYGKNIIGTTEAFEGYEVDISEIGALCNSKEQFISEIRKCGAVKRRKFNEKSREYYLQKYSYNATLHMFEELIR